MTTEAAGAPAGIPGYQIGIFQVICLCRRQKKYSLEDTPPERLQVQSEGALQEVNDNQDGVLQEVNDNQEECKNGELKVSYNILLLYFCFLISFIVCSYRLFSISSDS